MFNSKTIKIGYIIIINIVNIVPFSFKRFPNERAPKVPNNIPRNPPFCYFASFLIIPFTIFINNPNSLGDSAIFRLLFISSLEIINVVKPDLNIFSWIAAFVADAADNC